MVDYNVYVSSQGRLATLNAGVYLWRDIRAGRGQPTVSSSLQGLTDNAEVALSMRQSDGGKQSAIHLRHRPLGFLGGHHCEAWKMLVKGWEV